MLRLSLNCILLFIVLLVNCIDYKKYGTFAQTDEQQEVRMSNSNSGIVLRPEQSIEFKIPISKYKEECYYANLKPNDIFHVIINVIKGGTNEICIRIYDPFMTLLHNELKTSYLWYHNDNITVIGDYKICLKNLDPQEKIVFVNAITYTYDELREHQENEEIFGMTQEVLYGHLDNITNVLGHVRRLQIVARRWHVADEHQLEVNNEYVMYYSIAETSVIVLCGFFQVFFIKKLFSTRLRK